MKKLIVLFALFACGDIVEPLQAVELPSVSGQYTTEQIAARRSGKRERMLRKTGGFILRVPETAGFFNVINAQRKVPATTLEPFVRDMGRFTSTIVRLVELDKAITLTNATEVLKKSGAGGCVFIVDEPTFPISLVAQEAKWGFVNVAALSGAGVDEKILSLRTAREAWRVFALVTGAGDTSMGHCLLKPVFAPDDLDNINANSISPEPLLVMTEHMKAMGVNQVTRCTYLEACREGWAPAPTNEYQRAIWEKVKADKERGPTNPITIKPPNAAKGTAK